jgi:hypothetical protein
LKFEQFFILPQSIPYQFEGHELFQDSSINWLIKSITSFQKPIPDSGSVGSFFHFSVSNECDCLFKQFCPKNASLDIQTDIFNRYHQLPDIFDRNKATNFLYKLSESFSKSISCTIKKNTTDSEEDFFIYGVNKENCLISLQWGFIYWTALSKVFQFFHLNMIQMKFRAWYVVGIVYPIFIQFLLRIIFLLKVFQRLFNKIIILIFWWIFSFRIWLFSLNFNSINCFFSSSIYLTWGKWNFYFGWIDKEQNIEYLFQTVKLIHWSSHHRIPCYFIYFKNKNLKI